MKRSLPPEKGSIYLITLNFIIILAVILFSLSFNTLATYHSVSSERLRLQAYLNAKSGIVMAMKELKDEKSKVPFEKKFDLFGNPDCSAEVSLDYVTFEMKDTAIELHPAASGSTVQMKSVGKYRNMTWTIIKIMRGGKELLYDSR